MELLVRIRDKINPDPIADAKCTKRGDVIHVAPDGHVWGLKETTNDEWRIIRVGFTVNEAGGLLAPEQTGSRMDRKRKFAINLDALGNPDLTYQPGVTKPVVRITNANAVRNAIVTKTPLADPDIIGPQGGEVIG